MAEQQAIAAIGYSPDSASVTTCGPENKLWECRLLKYGDLSTVHDLIIYEQKIGGAWYVNSWIAH
jgi:hypothetical protein